MRGRASNETEKSAPFESLASRGRASVDAENQHTSPRELVDQARTVTPRKPRRASQFDLLIDKENKVKVKFESVSVVLPNISHETCESAQAVDNRS